MRRVLFVSVLTLWVCGPAMAGMYIPGEPADFVPIDGKVTALSFDRFRLKMTDLTGAALALDPRYPTSDLGKKYVALMKELQQQRRQLSAERLTSLGGYYYRLVKWDDALDVFLEASRKDRTNFEAYSDLVVLYLVQGQYTEARTYFGSAKQPPKLPGMSSEESAWCYKVDGYLLKLIRERSSEKRNAVPPNQLHPDNLFGVEFVGESGGYEAGKLAQVQKSKLPEDSIAIVQQLLFWMPGDARLYWQLAELYNASGEMENARTIMNECVDSRRYQPDLLREHRRQIDEEIEQRREQRAKKQRESEEEQAHNEGRKKKIMIGVAIGGGAIILLLLYWQVGILLRKSREKNVGRSNASGA